MAMTARLKRLEAALPTTPAPRSACERCAWYDALPMQDLDLLLAYLAAVVHADESGAPVGVIDPRGAKLAESLRRTRGTCGGCLAVASMDEWQLDPWIKRLEDATQAGTLLGES